MVYVSDKRLHVNADRSKVVPEDSEDAAYLLVGEGGELSDDEANRYGLHKAEPERKAEPAPPENKAESMPTTRNAQGSGLTVKSGKK